MSLTSHNSPLIFQDLCYMTIEHRIVSEIYLERLEINKEFYSNVWSMAKLFCETLLTAGSQPPVNVVSGGFRFVAASF